MASVLALISKAVFEKMARDAKPGEVVATDAYLSTHRVLESLGEGGSLFLVTVRPPEERLWLVAVLEKPERNDDGWRAAANRVPLVDVTDLVPALVFSTGKGLAPKKGALGMSLQTPRVLTTADETLLRRYASPAAATTGRSLRFDAFRPAAPLAELPETDRRALEDFRETIEEQSEFGGVERLDVVVEATGKTAYRLFWWPFTDGVLIDVSNDDTVGDLCDGVFTLCQPNRALREALQAAYEEAHARKQVTQIMFANKGETATAAPRPEPAPKRAAGKGTKGETGAAPGDASYRAKLDVFDRVNWPAVTEAFRADFEVKGEVHYRMERAWFERLVDDRTPPAKAASFGDLLRNTATMQGRIARHASEAAAVLCGELLRDRGGKGCRAPAAVLATLGDLATGGRDHDVVNGFDRGRAAPPLDVTAMGVVDAAEGCVSAALVFLAHREPAVRAAAAWAVGWAAPLAAAMVPALREALAREEDAGTAVGLLWSLSLNLGYTGAARDELRPLIDDPRPEVAAAAAAGLVLHGGATDALLLARLERPTAAEEATPFHFGGGNVRALVLLALARLARSQPDAATLLARILDDRTPVPGTRLVASDRYAAALAPALPRVVKTLDDLLPEQRDLLALLIDRPRLFMHGPGYTLPIPWFGPLALGRWLGVRAPSVLPQRLPSGQTIEETVLAAIRGGGPLDLAARAIADAVSAEGAMALAEDLLGYGQNASTVGDLRVAYARLPPAEQAEVLGERSRRQARLLDLVRRIVAARVPLPALLLRVGGELEWSRSSAGASLLAAADEIAGGAPLDVPGLDGQLYVQLLASLATIRDFADPVRRLLARSTLRARHTFFAHVVLDGARPNPALWLYVDLFAPGEVEELVQNYNLQANQELTPPWLARVGASDAGLVSRVLDAFAARWGGETAGHLCWPGSARFELRGPDGKTVTVFSSPPVRPALDHAPWVPRPDQLQPA